MLISTEYTVLKYFEMEFAHYVKGVDLVRRFLLGNFECRCFHRRTRATVLAESRMRFVRIFCYQIYICFFFLPLSGRLLDSGRNTVSKSRKNQDNQPKIT